MAIGMDIFAVVTACIALTDGPILKGLDHVSLNNVPVKLSVSHGPNGGDYVISHSHMLCKMDAIALRTDLKGV